MMIHPLAHVQSSKIGEGTRIWQYAVVLTNAVIGKHCNINCHTFIENDVVIGDYCTIKSGVYVWDGMHIEDHVFIGPNVTFINNNAPRSQHYPAKHIGAIIRQGASIGAGAIIKSQIEIGAYAMIGAGSLLTKSVKPFELWYGNPSKHEGYVTKDGIILTLELLDKLTGDKYQLYENEPIKLNNK
jgi:UDP-2-acetamido-3-amino-2,3-dideoxy-glucuronate N-acetyltransferase